eukprot:XP_001699432.1 predicted protein [Chlamydomonas reinhardtii]
MQHKSEASNKAKRPTTAGPGAGAATGAASSAAGPLRRPLLELLLNLALDAPRGHPGLLAAGAPALLRRVARRAGLLTALSAALAHPTVTGSPLRLRATLAAWRLITAPLAAPSGGAADPAVAQALLVGLGQLSPAAAELGLPWHGAGPGGMGGGGRLPQPSQVLRMSGGQVLVVEGSAASGSQLGLGPGLPSPAGGSRRQSLDRGRRRSSDEEPGLPLPGVGGTADEAAAGDTVGVPAPAARYHFLDHDGATGAAGGGGAAAALQQQYARAAAAAPLLLRGRALAMSSLAELVPLPEPEPPGPQAATSGVTPRDGSHRWREGGPPPASVLSRPTTPLRLQLAQQGALSACFLGNMQCAIVFLLCLYAQHCLCFIRPTGAAHAMATLPAVELFVDLQHSAAPPLAAAALALLGALAARQDAHESLWDCDAVAGLARDRLAVQLGHPRVVAVVEQPRVTAQPVLCAVCRVLCAGGCTGALTLSSYVTSLCVYVERVNGMHMRRRVHV